MANESTNTYAGLFRQSLVWKVALSQLGWAVLGDIAASLKARGQITNDACIETRAFAITSSTLLTVNRANAIFPSLPLLSTASV
jgi:hypothetical protein